MTAKTTPGIDRNDVPPPFSEGNIVRAVLMADTALVHWEALGEALGRITDPEDRLALTISLADCLASLVVFGQERKRLLRLAESQAAQLQKERERGGQG